MNILQKIGVLLTLIGLLFFTIIPFLGSYKLDEETTIENTKEIHTEAMVEVLQPMFGKLYTSNLSFISSFKDHFNSYNEELKANQEWDKVIWDDYTFILTKAASMGPVNDSPLLYLMASIGLTVIGGLFYILPLYRGKPSGIKNDGIFFSSMMARGWLGMLTGSYLILFYIILYWFPEYLTNLVLMVDPLSQALSGGPASQWFLYGFIYSLAIVVMGLRMFRKYKGNKYQMIRTSSVMFFQLSFAFCFLKYWCF